MSPGSDELRILAGDSRTPDERFLARDAAAIVDRVLGAAPASWTQGALFKGPTDAHGWLSVYLVEPGRWVVSCLDAGDAHEHFLVGDAGARGMVIAVAPNGGERFPTRLVVTTSEARRSMIAFASRLVRAREMTWQPLPEALVE